MAHHARSWLLAVGLALAPAAVTLVACGPSAGQIKTAREARYVGTRDEVYLAVSTALAKEAKIERSDPEQAVLMTLPRWYEKDGTYEDKGLGSDTVMAEDGSILLALLVRVVGDQAPFQVVVEPMAEQIRSGYSARYRFLPGDPQLPGWIAGKVDDLQLALHARLQKTLAMPPGTVAPQ
jgi:hypothetical protein